MRVPWLTFIGIVVLALSAVVDVALLPVSPFSVTIRFGADGDPDSFVAAPLGMFFVPATGVGALLVTHLADASGVGTGTPPILDAVLAVFLTYVQALVLARNLSARFDMIVAIVPAVAAFGVVAVIPDRAGWEDEP